MTGHPTAANTVRGREGDGGLHRTEVPIAGIERGALLTIGRTA